MFQDNIEKENSPIPSGNIFNEENLRERIAIDIKSKIDSFVNTSAALSAFERNTGISKRQINRYLSKNSSPQFINLKSIYSFIYGEQVYNKLLHVVHPIVNWALEEKNNKSMDDDSINYNKDLSEEMEKCPAFLSIYWQTADQGTITAEKVIQNFGDYGKTVLKKMLSKKIIKECIRGTYTCGTERSVPVNLNVAPKVASNLILENFKSKDKYLDGSNYIGLNVIRLDEDAKDRVLKKMYDLNNEIMEIANKCKGIKKRYFSVMCTDTMDKNEKLSSSKSKEVH